MLHRALIIFVSILLFNGSFVQASPEFFAKVRGLVEAGKLPAAIQLLESEQEKQEEKDLVLFELAYLEFKSEQYDKSIEHFKKIIEKKSNLEEYAAYFLSQALLKTNQNSEAEKYLSKIDSMKPNFRLKIESTLALTELELASHEYRLARKRLAGIEKKTRGSEYYSKVIYAIARAESGLKNKGVVCKWLKKIYTKYPTENFAQSWGPDLSENIFEGRATGCHNSIEDFRTRIRFILWAGHDQRAQEEITKVKERLKKESPFLADELQAQYHLQEGEPGKALALLKPHFEELKRTFNFLTLYAATAARAGEIETAIGSYYAAYKLSPRSKSGRQALYQSAFLSYQFQDYDGAGRRFREFIKSFSGSGLMQDAKWHLAWIQYLKGDFAGSYKEFSELKKPAVRKRKRGKAPGIANDRVTYWVAMSLLRQGKTEQARVMFADLAKDKLLGYYSLAAQARLKKLPPPPVSLVRSSGFQQQRFSRMSLSEVLMAAPEETEEISVATDDTEHEENLKLTELSPQDEKEDEDLAEQNGDGEQKQVDMQGLDELEEKVTSTKSPALAQRFTKARDLMIVGMEDWAKWDLYEIERKTSNKDFLKTLMSEYSAVEFYHRSSYISQISFSYDRAKHGIDGEKELWQYAYPQAYSQHVLISAKDFSIPQELIWGIMRAESQYRRDAISPVGALGLMQVMPFTGRRVAQMLNDRNFEPAKLLEPPTAVRIGSRYLARLMKKFDNSIPLVAAAYNAGPHRVQSWLISFGQRDTDEFIEHIPFLETRNYVKKVLSNCQVYANLYSKPKESKEMVPYMADPLPVKIPTAVELKENWEDI